MLKRMRKINKSSRTFVRFLISYILILLTPVIILTVILNNYFMRLIEDEIIRKNKDSLITCKRMIDMEIKQLHGVSYKLLYTNRYLSEYFDMTEEGLRNEKIKEELYNSIISNLLVSEVVLYTKNNSMMFTSSGSYSTEDFFDKMFKYEEYGRKDFLKDISTITSMYFVPAQSVYSYSKNERYVSVLYPSHPYSLNPRPGIMYLIQESKLLRYMQSGMHSPDSNGFILDENYKVIAAYNPEMYFDADEIRSHILTIDSREGYKLIKINGMDYFLFVSLSDSFSLKYVSVLPSRTFYEKINEARYMVAVGMMMILVFGGLIIYIFMKLNYLPIKQLRINIQRMFHFQNNEMDEIETVKEAIIYLADQNTSLSDRLNENIGRIKDTVVFSLLKGQIESLEDFNEYGKELGLEFTYKYFCSAIIYIDAKGTDEATRGDLSEIMKQNAKNDEYLFYCRDNIEKNQYVIVYNSPSNDVDVIRKSFDSVRVKAWTKLKVILTIGVGNSYDNVKLLPRSYIEASTALRHRFIKGNDQTILFGMLAKDWDYIDDYPKKEIAELALYIKQGNTAKIERFIGHLVSYVKNSRLPIFMARAFCFDIINGIVSATSGAVNKGDLPDIFFIESVGTVEELLDIIKDICLSLASAEDRQNQNNEEKILIERIVDYIKHNYYKCDFSIQGVSEHFDMKLSYMSQYFKTQMDTTVIDYVTALRVEKAKYLLVTTLLPLNFISEEIGYYNVSSFIRRFKQVTQMTPGEYRKEFSTLNG